MKDLNKFNFNISLGESGWYCYYKNPESGEFNYLRKDGSLERWYDGKFFKSAADAAYFLEDYIKKNYEPIKLTRAQIADAFGVEDFIIVD